MDWVRNILSNSRLSCFVTVMPLRVISLFGKATYRDIWADHLSPHQCFLITKLLSAFEVLKSQKNINLAPIFFIYSPYNKSV